MHIYYLFYYRYVYYENVSKTNNGSFKKQHLKPKVVPLYSCPEASDRCPVKILDSYIGKLPSYARETDIFYLRPLQPIHQLLGMLKLQLEEIPFGKK